MAIRVMLVDDHQLLREGLKSLLAKEMDIKVVGEADNGRDALAAATKLVPDVVVMDISMPGLNGIDTTRQLLADHPEVGVIALSMHSDRRYVSDMLAAGATGYLVKDSAFDELAQAIRKVADGRLFISGDVAATVLDDYVRRVSGDPTVPAASPVKALSAREREVLQLIAEGKSTKEIAAILHLSVKTIETHRRQVMEKLRIYNVAGLIKYAVREGLASLED